MKKLTFAIMALCAQAALVAQSAIPTPESVIGFKPGTEFKLANYDQTIQYFQRLDAASDKVQVLPMGTSTQGRQFYVALISTPANLARVDRYREIARRLASPEGLSEAEARALATEGKAIVHIDGGLHSTEVAGPQHTLQLAYDLVSRNDAEVNRILDNVILMLWPTINPDGHQMVADHYMKNVGTPTANAPLPGLYQEYVGHDNNRDAYMLNMVESRVMEHAWRQWEPQIVYVHHQTSPFPTRIWLPPFAEPIAPHAPFLMSRTVNTLGMTIAQYLEERGMVGATHMGTGFDAWYAGYIDYAPMFKNQAAFWTETALANMAATREYTTKDLPQAYQDLRPQSLYPSPWEGGRFGLADSMAYMQGASMAVLDWAARFKDNLLLNRWKSGRAQIEDHRNGGPYAYIVSAWQRDPVAAVEMLRRVAFAGVRVSALTENTTINGREYPAGSWVIPTDQEFIALARQVLDVQNYPDIRESPGGAPEQPYDAAGWTLPLSMSVDITTVTEPLAADVKAKLKPLGAPLNPTAAPTPYDSLNVDDPAPFDSAPGLGFNSNSVAAAIVPPDASISLAPAMVPNDPPTSSIAINPSEVNAFRAINQVWKAGGTVAWIPETQTRASHYVLGGIDGTRISEILRRLHVNGMHLRRSELPTSTIRKPRVALFRPLASMDEGWTRWVLERFEFEFASLVDAELTTSPLRDRFDVIVITDEPRGPLAGGGRGGRGGPGGGAGARGGQAPGLPEPDAARVKALTDFVSAGGTLVTMNRSTGFAIEQFKLPVRNALQGLGRQEFFGGGSLLKVQVDTTQPAMAGFAPEGVVFFNGSPAFETLEGFNGTVLATYAKEGSLLASGYLLGDSHLRGKAAALEVPFGQGKVILLGFRPQWRGQTFGTFKALFNSLLR
ncbi:MAG: hypothetical protein AMXMBFR57_11280 [Acidimicrobiia bacterium]|jgi:hypothetical protein